MTELCTVIGDGAQHMVSTIEHLVAALNGLGVDNCLVEVDGPEVPIMDGSAAAFVEAIDRVGVRHLAAPRRFIKILKTVRVEHGRAFSELRPAANGFRLDVEIDFNSDVIGRQRKILDLEPAALPSRDFPRPHLRLPFRRRALVKAGFALGASLDNSVGIDDGRILNPEGLRYTDEFVRHKMLDAVGDLALAGAPLIGSYHSYCGGHKMNVAVLEALFSDRANYRFVDRPRRIGKASAPISLWPRRRPSCPSAAEGAQNSAFSGRPPP